METPGSPGLLQRRRGLHQLALQLRLVADDVGRRHRHLRRGGLRRTAPPPAPSGSPSASPRLAQRLFRPLGNGGTPPPAHTHSLSLSLPLSLCVRARACRCVLSVLPPSAPLGSARLAPSPPCGPRPPARAGAPASRRAARTRCAGRAGSAPSPPPPPSHAPALIAAAGDPRCEQPCASTSTPRPHTGAPAAEHSSPTHCRGQSAVGLAEFGGEPCGVAFGWGVGRWWVSVGRLMLHGPRPRAGARARRAAPRRPPAAGAARRCWRRPRPRPG
jgi:hypothetical protein